MIPPTSSIASAICARVARAGALEHHMLDDVGEAIEMLGLGARADHRIDAERDGFGAGERIDRDRQAIGENVHLARSWLGLLLFHRFRTASP